MSNLAMSYSTPGGRPSLVNGILQYQGDSLRFLPNGEHEDLTRFKLLVELLGNVGNYCRMVSQQGFK
jgi:hypothetical protein